MRSLRLNTLPLRPLHTKCALQMSLNCSYLTCYFHGRDDAASSFLMTCVLPLLSDVFLPVTAAQHFDECIIHTVGHFPLPNGLPMNYSTWICLTISWWKPFLKNAMFWCISADSYSIAMITGAIVDHWNVTSGLRWLPEMTVKSFHFK